MGHFRKNTRQTVSDRQWPHGKLSAMKTSYCHYVHGGFTCWYMVGMFCTELLNKGQMTLWHFLMSTAQKNVVFQISKKVQFDEQGGHDSFWCHTILEKAD